MAITKAFKLAELIRHIEYDSTDDVIKTSKKTEDKNKKRGSETKTSTDAFNLDKISVFTVSVVPRSLLFSALNITCLLYTSDAADE